MLSRLNQQLQKLKRPIRRSRVGPTLAALASASRRGVAQLRVASRTPEPGRTTVVGLLSSTSGLGQAGRLTFSALSTFDPDTQALDVTSLCSDHQRLEFEANSTRPLSSGGTVLFHLNPPELPKAIASLRRSQLRRKKLIGYWAWELPHAPANWLKSIALVDEIWVPSRFVSNALSPTSHIHVVPHPVTNPKASALQREDFGIPRDPSTFLVVFDALSSVARKNPFAAIEAFDASGGKNSQLVIKMQNGDRVPRLKQRIVERVAGRRNIIIWDEAIPLADLYALIQCSTAIVSLHRSEGFGLVLAEAMLLGRPVIATGWSGNIDFMNENNSLPIPYRLVSVEDPQELYAPYQLWAEPSIKSAGLAMRTLATSPELAEKLGHAASTLDFVGRFNEAVCSTGLGGRLAAE